MSSRLCLLGGLLLLSAGAPACASADHAMSTAEVGPQPLSPRPQFLPTPTGPCPAFVEGTITVSPNGTPRDVEVWISDAAKTKDGPLVFFWHGTDRTPDQATLGLGDDTIQAIKDMGGMVVAPFHDPAAGFAPWFLALGGERDDDLLVADEVLGCALADPSVGVDVQRIHSMGMSAGGLQTGAMSFLRSGYLASVVTYSGGVEGTPAEQDPTNRFPAMSFYGGAADDVVISLADATHAYQMRLHQEGHFAFECNHDEGHVIPVDGVPSAWQFLEDHPFASTPDPYASGLPAGFPAYCTLPD